MSDEDGARRSLIRRLSEAYDHDQDPLPVHLTDVARDAFEWRRADVELAALLFDSANDELVGVRGTATERRSFRFGADEFVLRVHITPATLIMMIEPPLSVTCRLVTETVTTDHRTDELGELAVDAPELPFRLEVDLPSGTVVTPWITG